MPIRLRKLIGAIALIVLVVTWALVAMALAQSPAESRLPRRPNRKLPKRSWRPLMIRNQPRRHPKHVSFL